MVGMPVGVGVSDACGVLLRPPSNVGDGVGVDVGGRVSVGVGLGGGVLVGVLVGCGVRVGVGVIDGVTVAGRVITTRATGRNCAGTRLGMASINT